MNPEKITTYTISWSQEYPEYQEYLDNYTDLLVELSDFKEANEIIASIKNNLKN